MSFTLGRLGAGDVPRMRELNAVFATVFDDPTSYASAPPSDGYLERVLGRAETIVLVALADDAVIGGLVAYVLDKLEQERSEIYVYDLAVAAEHRRRGVATALIRELQLIAGTIDAWVIYVQADASDDPAIALYQGLGTREEVLHFDIPPRTTR